MRVVRVPVLLGLLLFPATADAQTVLGVVTEDPTGAPIAGALVELVGAAGSTAAEARTDDSGLFLLRPPSAGEYLLRLSHPSYVAGELDALEIRADETIQLELRMGREAIPLEAVIVAARGTGRMAGFHDRRERSPFGHFVTREDIERRGTRSTTELLRTLPGVHIVRTRSTTGVQAEDHVITMRAGQCTPAIYIDGVFVPQVAGSGIDRYLQPDMLEGIEVYSGSAGVPAQFVSDACGLIAFWTRTGDAAAGHALSWGRILAAGGVLTFMGLLGMLVR